MRMAVLMVEAERSQMVAFVRLAVAGEESEPGRWFRRNQQRTVVFGVVVCVKITHC